MSLLEQLRWSLRHSKKQLLESILVVLAIMLGVGVIITVLALLLSVNTQYNIMQSGEHFRTLYVLSKTEASRASGAPLVLVGTEEESHAWNATVRELQDFQRSLPPGMHAFAEMSWMTQTSLLGEAEDSEGDEKTALFYPWLERNALHLIGTTQEYFAFRGLTLERGHWFIPEDLEDGNRVLILANALAKDLFGDEDPVGKQIPVEIQRGAGETLFYTVIGVLNPPPSANQGMASSYYDYLNSRQAYVPLTASPYESWAGEAEARFSQISVGVGSELELVQAQERAEAEARLIWGDSIAIRSPLNEFRASQKQIRRYTLLIGVFASVGLVIAVINILNPMLARVLKRTKTIGISMALGSSRALVFRQFMVEALSLGLLGSLLGIGLSFGLALLLQRALGTQSLEDMARSQVLLGLGIGFAVSLFFGIYPAYLGSKVQPVDALRTE